MAVMMPIGISDGITTVRANKSAMVSKLAPKRNEPGSTSLWSAPKSNRIKWGTINPTKPIVPVKETAVPTINALAISRMYFTFCTSTPIWKASFSPMERALRFLYWETTKNAGPEISKHAIITLFQLPPPTSPRLQKVKFHRAESSA